MSFHWNAQPRRRTKHDQANQVQSHDLYFQDLRSNFLINFTISPRYHAYAERISEYSSRDIFFYFFNRSLNRSINSLLYQTRKFLHFQSSILVRELMHNDDSLWNDTKNLADFHRYSLLRTKFVVNWNILSNLLFESALNWKTDRNIHLIVPGIKHSTHLSHSVASFSTSSTSLLWEWGE